VKFFIKILMDSSSGLSYFGNQIQHKNYVMKVKTVSLCDVSIRSDLCLKL